MENYIKLKDVFDSTALKKVGDYWTKSWTQYRGIYHKLRIALRDNKIEDEINKLTLIQLKEIHNCMVNDHDLMLGYRDFTFIPKRSSDSVIIFNSIIDRIEAISNNVVYLHP